MAAPEHTPLGADLTERERGEIGPVNRNPAIIPLGAKINVVACLARWCGRAWHFSGEHADMSRFRKLMPIVVAGLALLAGGLLWALPEIVRRVALDQVPRRTGRAVAIGDIDLNLFTGHLAIRDLRLADREGPEPFVALERLDLRLGLWDLLRSHIRVRDLTLIAPSVRVVRRGPTEFNFSDLLARTKKPEPSPTPSRWTVTVERLGILRGGVRVDDRAVSPPAEWLIHDLGLEVADLSTRKGARPGRLALRVRINETALTAGAESFRLDPLQFSSRLTLDSFETGRLHPYVFGPRRTPYRSTAGRLSATLSSRIESEGEEIREAAFSGLIALEGLAVAQVGRTDPFVSASRVGVEVKRADVIARMLTVAGLDIEGLDVQARRDARGVIDVLEMFTPKASHVPPVASTDRGTGTSTQPAAPATRPQPRTLFPIIQGLMRGFEQIRIERITLAPSRAILVDHAVKPPTSLALTKLQARIDDFAWPVTGPATLTLSTELPGGGTLDVKGPVTLQPFDAALTVAIRNAPVAPYQAYFPIPARVSGRFNGDSQNRIAMHDGALVAQSKGNSWAQNVEVREPGAVRPAIRVERMDLVGIDFDWPKKAGAARASFRRPRIEVERSAEGSINLRRLFTTSTTQATTSTPAPAPSKSPTGPASEGRNLLETMRLEFGEVRIEDGFARFLDRTTQPAFSQDLSQLALTLSGFGNRPGRRARLTLQSVVGGDAGFDVRGEIGPLGAPAFVDLVGELRSFNLPSVDPYAAAAIGWVIKTGELTYRVRFKLDGAQLSADNDVVVAQLQVAPATGGDEVKRRIGLPLGLIVALIKDQKGDIHVNVPVTGMVNDPKFSFADAIWTAVKNVLVNVVTAPFKAIGRLFSGGDEKVEEPKIDPVIFAAGSVVLSPAMEEHLLRVADFLRRSPFVNLALRSVPSRGDVEVLKNEAVAARLRAFQKERGTEEMAVALAQYYKERLPDVPLPATVEERVAGLREREPAPDVLLADLGRRRLEATRERLLTAEGIPDARLTAGDAPPPATTGSAGAAPTPEPTGEGRVEFAIVAGE